MVAISAITIAHIITLSVYHPHLCLEMSEFCDSACTELAVVFRISKAAQKL